MRKHLLAAALLAALVGCHTSAAAPTAASTAAPGAAADAAFAALSKRAVDTSIQLSPVGATQTGDHRYDSELDDLSAAGRQKSLDASKQLLEDLDKLQLTKLSRENQVDAARRSCAISCNRTSGTAKCRRAGPGIRRSTTAWPAERSTG